MNLLQAGFLINEDINLLKKYLEINDKIFNAFGYAIKEKSTGGLENGESFVGIIRP